MTNRTLAVKTEREKEVNWKEDGLGAVYEKTGAVVVAQLLPTPEDPGLNPANIYLRLTVICILRPWQVDFNA